MDNKDTIIRTPTENVNNTLRGKRVLFLENDTRLDNGLEVLEGILKSAEIEYTILFNLSDLPLSDITKAINEYDTIVFMTQWIYDISKKLLAYVESLPEKKTIVEVFIDEPSWYYAKQHGTKHDVFVYSCQSYWGDPDKDTEKFYKITDNPYWDYKNKFDK
jgi:hypothetical protein